MIQAKHPASRICVVSKVASDKRHQQLTMIVREPIAYQILEKVPAERMHQFDERARIEAIGLTGVPA